MHSKEEQQSIVFISKWNEVGRNDCEPNLYLDILV
jgi:hypothetical protein